MLNTVSAFGVVLLLAAPVPKDGKKAVPTLVGKWECTELMGGGRSGDEAEIRMVSMEFTADGKVNVRFGEQSIDFVYATKPDKTPAEIDLTESKKSVTKAAIYKLDGDTLTFCMPGGNNQGRPEKLESPEGTDVLLIKFKRATEKK